MDLGLCDFIENSWYGNTSKILSQEKSDWLLQPKFMTEMRIIIGQNDRLSKRNKLVFTEFNFIKASGRYIQNKVHWLLLTILLSAIDTPVEIWKFLTCSHMKLKLGKFPKWCNKREVRISFRLEARAEIKRVIFALKIPCENPTFRPFPWYGTFYVLCGT